MFVELTSSNGGMKRDVNMLMVQQIKYFKDYTTLEFSGGSSIHVKENKAFFSIILNGAGVYYNV